MQTHQILYLLKVILPSITVIHAEIMTLISSLILFTYARDFSTGFWVTRHQTLEALMRHTSALTNTSSVTHTKAVLKVSFAVNCYSCKSIPSFQFAYRHGQGRELAFTSVALYTAIGLNE